MSLMYCAFAVKNQIKLLRGKTNNISKKVSLFCAQARLNGPQRYAERERGS
jgi:hypothetical protein